jgi:hypothetical protein
MSAEERWRGSPVSKMQVSNTRVATRPIAKATEINGILLAGDSIVLGSVGFAAPRRARLRIAIVVSAKPHSIARWGNSQMTLTERGKRAVRLDELK